MLRKAYLAAVQVELLLYRLFQLLDKVARLCIESGAGPKEWSQGFLNNELNHYLSILRFATTAA